MVIEVRVVSGRDWRVWRELRLAALADAPSAFEERLVDWQGASGDERRWRARLDGVPVNFVAYADDVPVGMVSGVHREDGTPELISMWVAPRARGTGAGDRLVQAVIAWAEQTGAAEIVVRAFEDNHRGQALYRRNGFAWSGETIPAPTDDRLERVLRRASARLPPGGTAAATRSR
jgi:GNAT superfamily N-acetyltransferase